MKLIKQFLFIIFLLLSTLKFNAQDSVILDQIVAVVGNEVILESEIESQFLQNQAHGMYTDRCDIVEQMLYQKLLVHQSRIDSIEVTKPEVDAELDSRINTFIQQFGTVEKLEEYFNKSLVEIKDEFRDIIKEQMLARKMHNEISGEVSTTPSEVNKFFKSIPEDSLPIIPGEIEMAQIIIYPEITRKEKKEARDKLDDLRERVLNGEKFEVLARLYSQDPGTASKGGDLGFVNRTDLVPEFAAVAFNLEPGEISRIVETDFGLHIIQLIEKRGQQINVRHILLNPKISPQSKIDAKAKIDSIAQLLANDSIDFEVAAMKYSHDEGTKNNGGLVVNPYTGTSKFEVKQLDPATNYAIKSQNLEVGDISKPFEATDMKGKKGYKIVLIKSKTEAHTASLKTDYQKIQELTLQDKKNKIVDKWVLTAQKDTYIRIIDKFKNCDYQYAGWLK